MTGLRIAADLQLPLESVTDTIGILAVKGSGKTFTFLVIAEEMIRRGLPVVIFDPIGVCWGLRSSADGKSEGLQVVVLGGSHGDLPLDPQAGRVLAEFAAKERRAIVFDFSNFETKADQIRFAQAFLSRLYEVNREPLHVVLDEADDVAPQKPFGEETRLLRAAEILVRRGRARGIGVTMVTQRPAVLNKNLLTQCGTLIIGRVTSPQDRKAIEAWVDANGTADQKAELWKSLASLPTTDKWVWSPVAGVFQRVKIRARETFDSSATPKLGQVRAEPRSMAPVDLEALKAKMGAAIEKAEQDDPKKLRARIAELEREVKRASIAVPARVETKVERVEVPVMGEHELSELLQLVDRFVSLRDELGDVVHKATERMDVIRERLVFWRNIEIKTSEGHREVCSPSRPELKQQSSRRAESPKSAAPQGSNGAIGGGHRKLLTALAQHPEGLSKAALALMAGYAKSGGSFRTYVSKLRTLGLIVGSREIRIAPELVS